MRVARLEGARWCEGVRPYEEGQPYPYLIGWFFNATRSGKSQKLKSRKSRLFYKVAKVDKVGKVGKVEKVGEHPKSKVA